MNNGKSRATAISTLLVAFLGLSGCVSTSVTSYTDPAYTDIRFARVAVLANLDDLSYREELEYSVQKYATKSGFDITPAIELYPPTREFNFDRITETLINNGYDGFILIEVASLDSERVYGSDGYGNTISGVVKSTDINAKLINLENGDTVWFGNADTSGSSYAGWRDMANSFSNQTIIALRDTQLMQTVPGWEK